MQKATTEISHLFRKLNPRKSYGQPWVLANTKNLPLTFSVLEITQKQKNDGIKQCQQRHASFTHSVLLVLTFQPCR